MVLTDTFLDYSVRKTFYHFVYERNIFDYFYQNQNILLKAVSVETLP